MELLAVDELGRVSPETLRAALAHAPERAAVVTASARSLPALICSIDPDMASNITCTCPPSRSVSAGPMPR